MTNQQISSTIVRLSDVVYRLADTGASLAALEAAMVEEAGSENKALLDYCSQLRAVKGEIRRIEGDLDKLSTALAA